MSGFAVDLQLLAKTPPMFEDLARASRKCREYAEEPFAALDAGPGPLRNTGAGLINQLTFTHNRIRGEVEAYFQDIHLFATTQGEKVSEAVELYRTVDLEHAQVLDQTLFDQATRTAVREMGGRSPALDLESPVLGGEQLPADPTVHLLPLPEYRSHDPAWKDPFDLTDELSGATLVRDLIWYGTSFAAKFGQGRPLDIVKEIVIPFTGDWANLRCCGDALIALDLSIDGLLGNSVWIADWINAVWQGNAADACWLHSRRLEFCLRGAAVPQRVLKLYGEAYHDVVDTVRELESTAESVTLQLLDWVVTLPLKANPISGLSYLAWTLLNPPDTVFQIGKLVWDLIDTVQLAVQAVWDFNARCELGALQPINGRLPDVPEASVGYGG